MSDNIVNKRLRYVVALGVAFLVLFTVACSSDKKDFLPKFSDRSAVPGMTTDSVTTLISDSGRIRYRVITEMYEIFDKNDDPYMFFPKKVYFERFNDSLKVESMVQCDTARYYSRRELWELKKNVKLISLRGEKFETQSLYWDHKQQRIYSDSFIRIEQSDRVIEGYGFESNESMTKYDIYKGQKCTFLIDSAEPGAEEIETKAAK